MAQRHLLHWRAPTLEREGVPSSAIVFDSESKNSWDEAVNTRRLMEEKGWRKVLIVSDPPHMRRLNWTWRHAFKGSGFEFTLVAAPADWWQPEQWWRNETAKRYVFQEMVKLAYYVLTKPYEPVAPPIDAGSPG